MTPGGADAQDGSGGDRGDGGSGAGSSTGPGAVSPATVCVAAGRPARTPGAPVNPPLVLSSTYLHGERTVYQRDDPAHVLPIEEAVGALEGGVAFALSSGMAAAAAAVSLVPAGGVVVAPQSAYLGVLGLLREGAEQGRWSIREVDPTDTAAVVAALDGADVVWLESPSNPLLDVADLPALLGAARERGVVSVVDNTFATPLGCRPLTLGADVVLHSATKYLSGHSDLLLGVLVTAPDSPYAAAIAHHRHLHGAVAGPVEAWLAVRGIRTLALRFERACANAATLAARLAQHPGVTRLRYPGVGAILAIEISGGAQAAEAVCDRTHLWAHCTSLGGVESQLERRRRYPAEPAIVPDSLVRLSVGIEDVEDLWADLDAALTGTPPTSTPPSGIPPSGTSPSGASHTGTSPTGGTVGPATPGGHA